MLKLKKWYRLYRKGICIWLVCVTLGSALTASWLLHEGDPEYAPSSGYDLSAVYASNPSTGKVVMLSVYSRVATNRDKIFHKLSPPELVAASTQTDPDADMREATAHAKASAQYLVDKVQADSDKGLRVASIPPGAPAGLEEGDEVVGVGKSHGYGLYVYYAESGANLSDVMATHDWDVLLISRPSSVKVVQLPATADQVARIGFFHLAAPLVVPDVIPPTGAVQGPSGGLSMTLAYLQATFPGDLFAGKVIAATGTVDKTGQVGVIGAVSFKTVTADAVSAAVMFVPMGNYDEAAASHPVTPLVKTWSVSSAVAWLCMHGATSTLCSTSEVQNTIFYIESGK